MLQNDALATAAHLHVLLRRKTGRVTDTEWMASNPEYARAMVNFARDKARDDGHTDLLPWADRLESLLLPPRATGVAIASEPSPASPPALKAANDVSARYIGRLR
jgi:hypothetical protein